MVSVGEVQSEVVVEGEGGSSGAADPMTSREQLREVVREILEELLERHLRTEERGG